MNFVAQKGNKEKSGWAGPFPHDDKLGLFQTSRGKGQPIICIYIFSDELAVADELIEGLTHNTLE